MHIKILKTSKKALLALFAFCSVFFAYTEQYQISETHYDIQGITREYPLKTKVEVDYHKIFENEEELLGYIKDLKIPIFSGQSTIKSVGDLHPGLGII